MTHSTLQLPELGSRRQQLIRIPAEIDVAVTPRVLALLDTPPMQRLRYISQLGVVSYVYPGAVHSRLEHSLGVYRLACLTLQHLLASETAFAAQVTDTEAKTFLLAALLHDIGHWPYCHAIEDLRLPEFPRHEALAQRLIAAPPISGLIEDQWQVDPQAVSQLIAGGQPHTPAGAVLRNLLSGPVDIDKMDYLQRDSHHAGVPYGRNFDLGRLVSSLCLGPEGRTVAITDKGKTAAEMMVFARYVMFSEVYWQHAVRSATAMLQRLVYLLRDQLSTEVWLMQTESEFAQQLQLLAEGRAGAEQLATGLWGCQRGLYKRLAQFSLSDSPQLFAAVARRPYADLVQISHRLAARLSRGLSRPLESGDVIIDAPPVKLEVQFRIDVRQTSKRTATHRFLSLSEVSPVVRALATEQFDNHVKRVRIFIAPERAAEVRANEAEVMGWVLDACGSP